MSTVISVENLGKKYTLRHQQREPYKALRDLITNGVTSLGKKRIKPFRRSLDTRKLSEVEAWPLTHGPAYWND